MIIIHPTSFSTLLPPPDPGGRKCAGVPRAVSPTVRIRTTMVDSTRTSQRNHSPSPGSVRLTIMSNQHSTNPAPAVPADDDFPIAPPVGPPLWGNIFATSRHDCRSLVFHVSHVNCVRGVAFSSTPAAFPFCIPHAPFRTHCTVGGPVHRRPHRSSHRTHRVRFTGSPMS